MHHPWAKEVVSEIIDDHICITADDAQEFLDALTARGFAIAMVTDEQKASEPLKRD